MGNLFKRPTFTREITGIERTPDINLPAAPMNLPLDRLGTVPPSGLDFAPQEPIQGQLQPFTRNIFYQGVSPGLAALADFMTAFGGPRGFGSGMGIAAEMQQQRNQAPQRFFKQEQEAADVGTQRTLQMQQIRRQEEAANEPLPFFDKDTGRLVLALPKKIMAGDVAGGLRVIESVKKMTAEEVQGLYQDLKDSGVVLSPIQMASLALVADNRPKFAAEMSRIRAEVERDKQAEEKAAALVAAQAERDKKTDERMDKRFSQMLTLQNRAFAQMDKRDTEKRTLGKPPTATEQRVFNFFSRALDAEKTIRTVEEDIAKMGLAGQTALNFAPNFLQSQTGQLYNQATKQFTEARLRKESGAAIAQSEYENDRKTYFAQPGDTVETLKRKREARLNLLESVLKESGKAAEGFEDELVKPGKSLTSPKRERVKVDKDGNVIP